ncbi:Cna B-type domain-containing protein [uncultured Senegalimassilia sp.]|uniref:Cna B-type domain-containing protein n=1 Tax=uncultured Senegalimassilia sp. TaxID=1714350 RepID=UPI0027DC6229|nr:MBG domain-containing protein [uncultured Senegalimassilia sp.]
MKRFRKALGIVALALVVSLSLAMPVSAWADEAESYGKPDVSGPQSAWYNGQSHHFRSTVKDSVSGKDLVEGEDYTRSFGFIRDRGNAGNIDTWLPTDDSMESSGFVWERIDFKGNYTGNGSYFVRHNIMTLYEFEELSVTKVEGEADPTLGATLSLFVGDPTTPLDLSAFNLSREAGEQPGEYAITYTTDPEQLPEAYTSNSKGTRTGLGDVDLGDGYIYKMVVGDDICGYNYIRIVPGTLTIVPAYTDVSATIAWKDSSDKDGLRPSAEDYAKLLSLTADGVASDILPVVVDNGDDTYTVTYTGVRQYAYDDNGERYDVDYKITQADVDGYTTDNATVGNEGVITNTHEVKADPAGESEDESNDKSKDDSGNKPEANQVASNDELAKTGDQTPNALVALALGASALGIAVVAKRRSKR